VKRSSERQNRINESVIRIFWLDMKAKMVIMFAISTNPKIKNEIRPAIAKFILSTSDADASVVLIELILT
jgi:hypothetical protein